MSATGWQPPEAGKTSQRRLDVHPRCGDADMKIYGQTSSAEGRLDTASASPAH
jgi:hypothetical protein